MLLEIEAGVGETLFKIIDLISMIKVFDLLESPFFMPELASFAVGTVGLLMELLTFFGFIFVVNWILFSHDLLISMSKLTLATISAMPLLNPVLTHLCFKFSLVDLCLRGV